VAYVEKLLHSDSMYEALNVCLIFASNFCYILHSDMCSTRHNREEQTNTSGTFLSVCRHCRSVLPEVVNCRHCNESAQIPN